ncbi:MAG TPA: APH(3') family aminoglycoside O-phosphotransferase [Bacillales bacterium]|nr:APH(3') family aminoglycoside O-phosphotransferase [Bacillales bacterium]
MNRPFTLPERLIEKIGDAVLEKDTLGMSEASVFKVIGREAGESFYLKAAVSATERLEEEAEVLGWLKGKLPVPEVLYYGEHGETEYLLLSEITGRQAADPGVLANPHELGRLMAEGLKMIHEVGISECPFDQTLETKIAIARCHVHNGLVCEDDFQEEYQGHDPVELLRRVEKERPSNEDLVFTHGDYCLPNIILDENQIQGFIDWGRAGIADRHQDLALAIRTLNNNGVPEAVETFKTTYGEAWFDQKKVEYFILLDELF